MSAAVTWRSAAGSVLRHNVRFLCALGVWRPAAPWPVTAGLLALGAAHIAAAGLAVYASASDLQLLTLSLSNAFPVSVGFAKAALLAARHRRYSALVAGVDALERRQRGFCEAEPRLATAFRASRRWSARLTFGFFSSVLLALVAWSLVPLSLLPQVHAFPFQQLPWPALSRPPTYWILYAHQCLATFFFCSIDMNTDCFFATVMTHISTQFKILSSRIADLRLRESTRNTKLCADVSDTSTPDDEMYKELCLCIDTHKELIRLVGLLESLMNPVAMLQFLVGAVSSCVVLFSATYSPDSSSAMKCWGSLPLLLTQLFLYCSGAQHILDESEAVALAAYDCGWCEASGKVKHALQLVAVRAQKPLALTAGSLYPVKRATFLSLIQATYSYYTLLQNLDN